jgi:hypothetical protein
MTVPLMSRSTSPELHVIINGKCDFPSCPNIANYFCDECHYVEHCKSCFEQMMARSEIYNIYMQETHQYTCIYCFMDMQQDSLRSIVGEGDEPLENLFGKMSPLNYDQDDDDEQSQPYR